MSHWDDARSRLLESLTAFVAGDPEPYKAGWSHADDVSIFGGWGAYERGWDAVAARLDWAASRYRGGEIQVQNIATHVGETIASTIDPRAPTGSR